MIDDARIVVSVQHSGTRFLKERLGINRHIHTVSSWELIVKNIEGNTVFSPLRDPKDVWHSFRKRWRNDEHPQLLARFYRSWYILHSVSLVHPIEFIPVDKKEDSRIKDWTPVSDEVPVEDIPPNTAKVWLAEIYDLPFIRQYYTPKR